MASLLIGGVCGRPFAVCVRPSSPGSYVEHTIADALVARLDIGQRNVNTWVGPTRARIGFIFTALIFCRDDAGEVIKVSIDEQVGQFAGQSVSPKPILQMHRRDETYDKLAVMIAVNDDNVRVGLSVNNRKVFQDHLRFFCERAGDLEGRGLIVMIDSLPKRLNDWRDPLPSSRRLLLARPGSMRALGTGHRLIIAADLAAHSTSS